MASFEKYFIQTKGQPVDLAGETIYLSDTISLKLNEEIIVIIESTNSEFIQGIGFTENVSIFGETVKKAVVFEHYSIPPEERKKKKSKLPFTFTVKCKNKKGYIRFYNMALINGTQHMGHNGFAMKKEKTETGWRYKCNDVKPNDDFTDLIFTISRHASIA
ncbi:MAG: hypothetical protein IM638_00865 [Bacteroidetes bacterium]|nr:hypothetical protein [Bacteroidota bacterium]